MEFKIETYLEDLEKRIDPDVESELGAQWKTFLDGGLKEGFFSPRRQRAVPSSVPWPRVTVNEALDDPGKMVLQQLYGCHIALAEGSGTILNVRPNFGAGLLPSIYGAGIFRMEDAMDTLPTSMSIEGGRDAILRLLDQGLPALETGYGKPCLEMGKRFMRLFGNYPRVSEHVRLYHPDLQGPMDVCELLWGSSLFLDLIDCPDLVHTFLHNITGTYIRFLREWERIVPRRDEYTAHWGMLQRGQIMIRDDSAMNLSPEMFDEFIGPYDRRLLAECGGGAIHFCGRGDHYIDRLARLDGLYAVNLSQPEYNDMEVIFRHTIDKGITLLGMRRETAEESLRRGRALRGKVHCW